MAGRLSGAPHIARGMQPQCPLSPQRRSVRALSRVARPCPEPPARRDSESAAALELGDDPEIHAKQAVIACDARECQTQDRHPPGGVPSYTEDGDWTRTTLTSEPNDARPNAKSPSRLIRASTNVCSLEIPTSGHSEPSIAAEVGTPLETTRQVRAGAVLLANQVPTGSSPTEHLPPTIADIPDARYGSETGRPSAPLGAYANAGRNAESCPPTITVSPDNVGAGAGDHSFPVGAAAPASG